MKAKSFVVALLLGFITVMIAALVARADDFRPSGYSVPKKIVRAAGGCVVTGVFDVVAAVYGAAGTVIVQPTELFNWATDKNAKYGDLTKEYLGALYGAGKEIGHSACVNTVKDLFTRGENTPTLASAAVDAGAEAAKAVVSVATNGAAAAAVHSTGQSKAN